MFVSVALIHSSVQTVPMLTRVAHEVMADVQWIHIVDESIPLLVDAAGEVTEPVVRRLCSHAINAQEVEAEAVMLTDPDVGRAVDAVRAAVSLPVVHINEAMVDAAARLGGSVGLLAESSGSLEPVRDMLLEQAATRGKSVSVAPRLVAAAGQARRDGDEAAYDRLVLAEVEALADNDIILLADVMMERVVHQAAERYRLPVLSGPRHGFEQLATRLNYFRR
jgi:hypothetical protein